jgi:thiamine-phosphate pyrophosphorylase
LRLAEGVKLLPTVAGFGVTSGKSIIYSSKAEDSERLGASVRQGFATTSNTMKKLLELPPLYPITDANQELSLSDQVLRFADAGYPLVQFRGKPLGIGQQWNELRQALAHSYKNGGWPQIVVNDRADLAILAAAEGIPPWGLHLGQTDLPACVAAKLPQLSQIHLGASTHNPSEWSCVDTACDHAGVGPVRATVTKPEHDATICFEGLHCGCMALRSQDIVPVAIGGLSVDDALPCYKAGAVSIAMSKALSPSAQDQSGMRLSQYLWQAQAIKYKERTILNLCNPRGVVIVGGSGAGKTSLANSLALRMNLKAVDLDLQITQVAGLSIAEIFDKGEDVFRRLENECLLGCMEHPAVLALGAGAWEQQSVRQFVKKSKWDLLWLAERPSVAWNRVGMDTSRPLAGNREEFLQRWHSRMKEWTLLPSLLPLGRTADELAEMLCGG